MLLRASYPTETKRGTLVHELAHRSGFPRPLIRARADTGNNQWIRMNDPTHV